VKNNYLLDINKKQMEEGILTFFKVFVLVLIIDLVLWIGIFFKTPVANMIEGVQKSPMVVRPLFAGISYIVLTAFIYFALLKSNTIEEAFLFGFLAYAIYDTTNLATLKGWDPQVATVDMLWGGLLMAILFMILK